MNQTTTVADESCLMRGTPLDPFVSKLIKDAAGANRGFALGLADRMREDGKQELAIRVEQVLPPVDEHEKPVSWRAHAVEDVESLISLAKKYSDKERGLVLYNDEGATLCLDETKERGQRELIRLAFKHSPEFLAWKALLAQPHQHKPLLDAMLKLQHTLFDPRILVAMRQVKLSWEADHESDLRVDGETFGVQFKSKAGNSLIDFPRSWTINVPILDQDLLQDEMWVSVEVKLEVELPTRPEAPVLFKLFSPKLGIAVRSRIDAELVKVRTSLDGWTIARGTHNQTQRHVGANAKT